MAQEPDPLHSRTRILIVDDEAPVRTMFQRVLHHAGFDAITATGGAEGLRLLKQDPTIGLVMLDLMMPECDGWRFRHAQRADIKIAHIPTLIVTGSPLDQSVDDQLQAAGYLLKPVSPDYLVSVVSSHLSQDGGVSGERGASQPWNLGSHIPGTDSNRFSAALRR
jgi:two-component system, chemotaxis family, chemotaxis protein CheY